jgi:hypothetical protein
MVEFGEQTQHHGIHQCSPVGQALFSAIWTQLPIAQIQPCTFSNEKPRTWRDNCPFLRVLKKQIHRNKKGREIIVVF